MVIFYPQQMTRTNNNYYRAVFIGIPPFPYICPMIPFYLPNITPEMIRSVTECLQSGWLNAGPWTQKFESALLAYCQADALLAVSSNTAGMELALRWLGIQPGDEVIVPAYSYCASAHVVYNLGAKPVFWDCGADLLPDPALLPSLLSSKTKAVIAVDLGGMPADYPAILKVLEAWSATGNFSAQNEIQEAFQRPLLMADAAHSIGAWRNGIPSGRLADISVFSFHSAKNITTGDGGAIALALPASFDSARVLAWLKMASIHGKTALANPEKASGNFGYEVEYPGIKGNLTDFQAALGLAQLERYESDILPRRRKLATLYNSLLSEFEWAGLPNPGNDNLITAWHIYPLILKWISPEKRNALIEKAKQAGIGFSVHYTPVPALKWYRELGYDPHDYPNSLRLSGSEITLPLYETLTEAQVEQVVGFVSYEL
jgi:dTDP-4-amino-4,6-dideoxygalactose transaminase